VSGHTFTPETLRRTSRRDLVKSALHEVAHATVARAYGGRADALVWPNPGAWENPLEEKFWVGRCFHTKLEGQPLRLLGLAGELAGYLYDDPEVPVGEAYFFLEDDEHSDTDAEARDGYTWEDVEAALDLLRAQWPEIRREAAAMVWDARKMEAEWRDRLESYGTPEEQGYPGLYDDEEDA